MGVSGAIWGYLSHLHHLLDPVHVHRDTDENVGLPRVSAAPHGDDHPLQDPAVAVLTGQGAAVVSLQTEGQQPGVSAAFVMTWMEVFICQNVIKYSFYYVFTSRSWPVIVRIQVFTDDYYKYNATCTTV